MNAWQMTEHVSAFFKLSTEKITFPVNTPPEHLFKFKEFLLSEKQFRENTKAPVLPDEPLPLIFSTMQQSINDLTESVDDFFIFFSNDHLKTTSHPVFGNLNFDEWVQLHHKHVSHHLRQFGLI